MMKVKKMSHFSPIKLNVISVFLELSALGIYPQLNKQAFVRDVIDIINKNLNMVRLSMNFFVDFILLSFLDTTIRLRLE